MSSRAHFFSDLLQHLFALNPSSRISNGGDPEWTQPLRSRPPGFARGAGLDDEAPVHGGSGEGGAVGKLEAREDHEAGGGGRGGAG